MILFVGDKPSPRMAPTSRAFQGAACEDRVYKWINKILSRPRVREWAYPAFRICNSTDNDCIYYARESSCVIALGNNASKFLTSHNISHFKLPHPSGRNRQINDKTFIALQLELAKIYINSTLNSK